jgi:peptide/nickel transport system permease protein
VLFGVSIVVFLLVRLIPGDPATAQLGARATPALVQAARRRLRLDEPLWQQYVHYINGALHGDFGTSYFYQTPVFGLALARIPVTLELLGLASIMALLITFPAATLAAAHRGRTSDHVLRLTFTAALGVPSFWLGLILALYFGVRTHLFPVVGAGTGGVDRLYHLILPAFTIAVSMVPLLGRALRSSLIEVMQSDFVTTAQAAGLRRRFYLRSYLWRNSILPLITVYSVNFGWLIGGTVIVEEVFGLPGLGSLLINSITTRDYAIVQMVAAILAFFVILGNLFTDIAYTVADPRVELHR